MTPVFLFLLACGQQVSELGDSAAPSPYPVEVVADGQSAQVDLAVLETVSFPEAPSEGDELVPVTALLEASGLGVDWSQRLYAFTGSDGFTPGQVGCDPPGYEAVQRAWLYPSSGNLAWDPELGLPTCYDVKGVVRVEAQLAPAPGR